MPKYKYVYFEYYKYCKYNGEIIVDELKDLSEFDVERMFKYYSSDGSRVKLWFYGDIYKTWITKFNENILNTA